jgi:NAD(P)-dependent dehydrogenase (short-subunit alcohol dehydrogenase family)
VRCSVGVVSSPVADEVASVLDRFGLDGGVAVVTGGASGIGREVALTLARAGAAVGIVDVDPAGLESAEQEAAGHGLTARAYRADVTSVSSLRDAAAAVAADLGDVRVLVACAGVSIPGAAVDISEEQWDATVDVNLKGAFFTTQAFAPAMLGRGGSVVFIASSFGLVGFPDRAAYVASKSALIGLTRALALEWAPAVRVNAICPCIVETPMVAERLRDETYAESMLGRIPLRRFAQTADIASAALFLAGKGASMITGHALAVDGGWTAQ